MDGTEKSFALSLLGSSDHLFVQMQAWSILVEAIRIRVTQNHSDNELETVQTQQAVQSFGVHALLSAVVKVEN